MKRGRDSSGFRVFCRPYSKDHQGLRPRKHTSNAGAEINMNIVIFRMLWHGIPQIDPKVILGTICAPTLGLIIGLKPGDVRRIMFRQFSSYMHTSIISGVWWIPMMFGGLFLC